MTGERWNGGEDRAGGIFSAIICCHLTVMGDWLSSSGGWKDAVLLSKLVSGSYYVFLSTWHRTVNGLQKCVKIYRNSSNGWQCWQMHWPCSLPALGDHQIKASLLLSEDRVITSACDLHVQSLQASMEIRSNWCTLDSNRQTPWCLVAVSLNVTNTKC